MLEVSGQILDSEKEPGSNRPEQLVLQQPTAGQQQNQRAPGDRIDDCQMRRVAYHRTAQHEQYAGKQGRRGVLREVPGEVEHEQASQEEVGDDLDFDESERQWGKRIEQHHQPIWRIKGLPLRISDNGESGK